MDEHLDGNIDAGIYQQKLQEYKKRQREITREMKRMLMLMRPVY